MTIVTPPNINTGTKDSEHLKLLIEGKDPANIADLEARRDLRRTRNAVKLMDWEGVDMKDL